MKNAGLDELQGRIKIGRRNINNLRYVGDTTLKAESKEELKSLLMKVKEKSDRAGLKLNIEKTKIMASGDIQFSRSVVSDSLQPHGPQAARILCPWNLPGKNTGACCHFLLQGIFLTQGSNPSLLHVLHW